MFFDHVKIFVRAGRGGDGCVSFRREAHVPKGGPDGGDGGRGGEVVLVCDQSLRDLSRFRGRTDYRAEVGRSGEGARKHGASGAVFELPVPPGTRVEAADGSLVGELTVPGQRLVVARGGSGGRGNKQFATSTHQTPRFAEKGLVGEERELDLRLRLLADAGFVGLPNAGKSSLLARLTRAAPKVADYPFTTLDPVLGTLEADDRQLVVVDIPGLIEGASEGAGLGHEFLAHVERCRLLIHVLDLAPLDGSDPVENFETVENELAQHNRRLTELPRLLALSKSDLVGSEVAEAAAKEWRERLGESVLDVIVTSAATGDGLDLLRGAILVSTPVDVVDGVDVPHVAAESEDFDDRPDFMVFKPAEKDGYRVEQSGDKEFTVHGRGIELLVARFDLDNEEALRYIEARLRSIGVLRALERAGFESGNEIVIGDQTFELEV